MKGKLFLIVGPSGSGKSSVLKGLMARHPEYVYPLSATTRAMRPGEKDGEIYHFYSKEAFEQGIAAGEFLEHAVVHQDNYYGLIKKPVVDALTAGKTIVREVDIQGFDSIRAAVPKENLVTIFIMVTHKDQLIKRILSRSAMPPDELEKRRESMHREFARARDCDYMVENVEGELEKTIEKVEGVIQKEQN